MSAKPVASESFAEVREGAKGAMILGVKRAMKSRVWNSMLVAMATFALAGSAWAVDGTIEINQAKVLANGGFPYVISTANTSYRLTGSLTVPSSTSGLNVTAANVTIDLNGFSIAGPGAASSAPVGITTSSGTVENGTITGFGVAIKLGSAGIVRNVHLDANGSGIQAGSDTLITGCTANNTTLASAAIQCSGMCTISGNTASGSAGIGIECGNGCTISGNTAMSDGVAGIQCDGNGCLISGNTANANSPVGIYCGGSGCLISGNVIDNNTGYPIDAADVTTAYGWNVMNGDGAGVNGGTSMAGKNTNSCGGTAC
jgi:parallel beta-helix repeat protein